MNVTPDKRKVFLHHEAEVLQTLQQVMLTSLKLGPPCASLNQMCAMLCFFSGLL